jgi:uncharacterized protein YeaO (DUF488 family)
MAGRPPSRFEVRRVYGHPQDDGSYRVLVDRLWPRGVAKADAPIDEWDKDVAPSTELRRWYGHDPTKFGEFARRYRDELRHPPASEALAKLHTQSRMERVALMTAARDVEHSGAVVLLAVLERRDWQAGPR